MDFESSENSCELSEVLYIMEMESESETSGACGIELNDLRERFVIPIGRFSEKLALARNTDRNVPAVCRTTGLAVNLRVQKKCALKKFEREFSYSRLASQHRNIITTFDVRYCSEEVYAFIQEHVPLGYLDQFVQVRGELDDFKLKRVMCQIGGALKFLHGSSLVHRVVCVKNVAVFDSNMELVKLTDFSWTQPVGAMVRKQMESTVASPPEVAECVRNEWYPVEPSADVWGMAILLYYSSTGSYPWDLAEISDSAFTDFIAWQKRKTVRIPSRFKMFSPRALRLFRRLFEPKESRRCSIAEVDKYVKDTFTGRSHRNSLTDDEETDFLVKLGTNVKVTAIAKGKQVKRWLKSGK